MKDPAVSWIQRLSYLLIIGGLLTGGVPVVSAQVIGGEPVIEIDKTIVAYDDTGQLIEKDHLGPVLVGTQIFFRYVVTYTHNISSTGTVTGTVSLTDTIPVGINLLTIRDDMGTLNPDDDFACIRASLPFTGTIPAGTDSVAPTLSITSTLTISDTVIVTDTMPLLPGGSFECLSSSGVLTDTKTGFTPGSGPGYLNTAVATPGVCDGDCEPSAADTAGYVGLYWAFTPGFWKNHTGDRGSSGHNAWLYTNFSPDIPLTQIFPQATDFGGKSLLDALRFKGGKGDAGAAKILLRAGVAALLNASFHEMQQDPLVGPGSELLLPDGRVLFPYSSEAIIGMINGLFVIPNRSTMMMIAAELDDINDGIHYIDWEWEP